MADLTIVVAAGTDPHYGLPGVSTRARQQQKRLSLGTIELVQVYSDTPDLRQSSWATRAWTFQEGYLAKKRLIFTDHEVSFLCEHMYCQESVDQKLVHRSEGRWDGLDGSHLFGPIPNRNREHFSADRILTEYTQRTLSFDTDALNACLGILKAAQISHWYGMPIEPCTSSDQLTMNLQWRNSTSGFPRSEFPTWSWAGISGGKFFPETRSITADYCTIHVPTADNQWLTIDDWMQSGGHWMRPGGDTTILKHSPRLRITAYVARPVFVDARWISQRRGNEEFSDYEPILFGNEPWAVLSIKTDILSMKLRKPAKEQDYQGFLASQQLRLKNMLDQEVRHSRAVFRVHLDVNFKNPKDASDFLYNTVVMLLQPGSEGAPRTYPVMLVLKPFGNHYKRVGITDWNHTWWMQKLGEGDGLVFTWQEHAIEDFLEKQTLYVE